MAASSVDADRAAMDKMYSYDADHVEALETQQPWKRDPKHFNKVQISALAAMKMLKHALSGVKRGQEAGGKPLEVMGLMLGKPGKNGTVVVMDCFPLPVEGFETRVVADDEEVSNYMINLSESLELIRPERFIGWYHSHPFDVETYSHCFLSTTDISTQLAWQRVLDPKWVAIVIDPLRSIAKAVPEFGAFRAYPPEHQPPKDECPDGRVVTDENARTVRWGKAFDRYYTLDIEYFMSGLGSQILDIMSRNHLWIRVLSSAATLEPENRQRFPDRVSNMSQRLAKAENQLAAGSGVRRSLKEGPLEGGSQAAAELAIEQTQGQAAQLLKHMLFNLDPNKTAASAAAAARPADA